MIYETQFGQMSRRGIFRLAIRWVHHADSRVDVELKFTGVLSKKIIAEQITLPVTAQNYVGCQSQKRRRIERRRKFFTRIVPVRREISCKPLCRRI